MSRITDTCKNITFPQLRLWAVKIVPSDSHDSPTRIVFSRSSCNYTMKQDSNFFTKNTKLTIYDWYPKKHISSVTQSHDQTCHTRAL